MMRDGDGKSEPTEIDPEKAAKLLEIELMQKRAEWQRAKGRRSSLRALSFFFLFAVLAVAGGAFYFLASSGTVTDLRSRQPEPHEISPSPTPLAP